MAASDTYNPKPVEITLRVKAMTCEQALKAAAQNMLECMPALQQHSALIERQRPKPAIDAPTPQPIAQLVETTARAYLAGTLPASEAAETLTTCSEPVSACFNKVPDGDAMKLAGLPVAVAEFTKLARHLEWQSTQPQTPVIHLS